MAKKLSVQTVAATAKTLEKAASTLAGDEERAIRMRTGVGLSRGAKLEQKHGGDAALAEKLLSFELMAFRAMGQKVYGLNRPETQPGAPETRQAASPAQGSKAKIIKALKRK